MFPLALQGGGRNCKRVLRREPVQSVLDTRAPIVGLLLAKVATTPGPFHLRLVKSVLPLLAIYGGMTR